jgi:hypothetical protein
MLQSLSVRSLMRFLWGAVGAGVVAAVLVLPHATARAGVYDYVDIQDWDTPGSSETQTCSTSGSSCFASIIEPYSGISGSATVTTGTQTTSPYQALFPGFNLGSQLTTSMNLNFGGYATYRPNVYTQPFVTAAVTGEWTLSFNAEQIEHPPQGMVFADKALNGSLNWTTTFTTSGTGQVTIEYLVSGLTPNNTLFSVPTYFAELTCANGTCTNLPSTGGMQVSGGNKISGVINLSQFDGVDLTLSEYVIVQGNIQAPSSGFENTNSGSFTFTDPMTLTYYDPNGNLVPNLFLVSGDGFIPLSGSDYIGAATPLPATWAMMLTGLLGVGFAVQRGAGKKGPTGTPLYLGTM